MQIDDWFEKNKSKFKMLVSYAQLKIRLYKLFNWQIYILYSDIVHQVRFTFLQRCVFMNCQTCLVCLCQW